jgi:3-isopropylmalate dehydrogenase
MLLRHSLGLDAEAAAVEAAVNQVVNDGILTGDLAAPGGKSVGTTAAGDAVVAALAAK